MDFEDNDIPDNFRPVGEFLKEMYDEMTFSEKNCEIYVRR